MISHAAAPGSRYARHVGRVLRNRNPEQCTPPQPRRSQSKRSAVFVRVAYSSNLLIGSHEQEFGYFRSNHTARAGPLPAFVACAFTYGLG
jgi:hypothetical protein